MRNYNRWTPAEVVLLSDLYPKAKRAALLAEIPAHTWSAIAVKARELSIKRISDQDWTESETATLRENYEALGYKGVSDLLGRSLASVRNKAEDLKLRRNSGYKRWTAEADELMLAHYPTAMPLRELAALLGRTKVSDLVKRARKLKIKRLVIKRPKKGPRKTSWSGEKDALVRAHYETSMPMSELAALIGKSVKRVVAYANKLKLRRRARRSDAATSTVRPKKEPVQKAAKAARPAPAPKVVKEPTPKKVVAVAKPTPPAPAPVQATVAPKKRGTPKEDTSPGSAFYIRNLPANHEERFAYMRGGRRSWEEFMKAKQEQQQLAEKPVVSINHGLQPHMQAVPTDRMLTVGELPAMTTPSILYMTSPFCGTAKQGRRERGAGGLALAQSEEVAIHG
jgi:hypothetical protein